METLNNVASAAAKAVWGSSETRQEPISGVKGNTAAGEPYDAGNIEPCRVSDSAAYVEHHNGKSQVDNTASAETGTAAESSNIDKQNIYSSSLSGGAVGKVVRSDGMGPAQPGNVKPIDVPDRPEEQSIPVADLSKPGPKPIETLARENGGDAGNAGNNKALIGVGAPADPHEEKSDEGSGDKYVKSTGFAAEGGNFDAAAAGAGREADRLLEENSVQDNTLGKHKLDSTGHASLSDTGGGEKKSLKEKIKAKLHKH